MKQLFTLIKNNKFYAIGLSIVTIIIIVFGAVTFVYNLPDPVIKYFLENQVAENRNKDIFNKDIIDEELQARKDSMKNN